MIKLNYEHAGIPHEMYVDIYYLYDVDTNEPKKTIVRLMNMMGQVVAEGMSRRHDKDRWNRATGRKVAFAKALELAGLEKAERCKVWDAYMSKVKVR